MRSPYFWENQEEDREPSSVKEGNFSKRDKRATLAMWLELSDAGMTRRGSRRSKRFYEGLLQDSSRASQRSIAYHKSLGDYDVV